MITSFEGYEYKDPRYSYIRYTTTDMEAILRLDNLSSPGKLCKILNLKDDLFREIKLGKEDLLSIEKDLNSVDDTFWRDATDEEIEKFKMTDTLNKYNI